ncbi:MAG: helix-turn-helix transcriptional regulator [Bacteroidota bacterium]
MRDLQLGGFEEIVLLSVAARFGDAYGVTIKLHIEANCDRKVSIGALRTTLNRLEKKGFLDSRLGEATSMRGGKRKRFYVVTPFGKKALDQVMEERKKLWQTIPKTAFNF